MWCFVVPIGRKRGFQIGTADTFWVGYYVFAQLRVAQSSDWRPADLYLYFYLLSVLLSIWFSFVVNHATRHALQSSFAQREQGRGKGRGERESVRVDIKTMFNSMLLYCNIILIYVIQTNIYELRFVPLSFIARTAVSLVLFDSCFYALPYHHFFLCSYHTLFDINTL